MGLLYGAFIGSFMGDVCVFGVFFDNRVRLEMQIEFKDFLNGEFSFFKKLPFFRLGSPLTSLPKSPEAPCLFRGDVRVMVINSSPVSSFKRGSNMPGSVI